jgi:hypothetical protein
VHDEERSEASAKSRVVAGAALMTSRQRGWVGGWR